MNMRRLTILMLLPLFTMSVVMADNEPIKYFERSWDEQNKQVMAVEKTCTNYTLLSGNHSDEWKGLTDGWYVVKESIVYYQTLNILGNAHIILCDGSYIILSGGVKLEGTRTLSIYGQTENSGVLSSTNTDYSNTAGIGSAKETTCGDLVIHGGTVYAEGKDAAGIGGGLGAHSGSFVMYEGSVIATGGDGSAGIGGGKEHGIGKSVTIYGGYIRTIGGEYGAGIGGGDLGNQSGPVNIYGGTVVSSGKFYNYGGFLGGGGGAGIGGGDEGWGGDVNIYGGSVKAYSRGFGAGIGGGQNRGISGEVNIMGGNVDAFGYEPSITFSETSGAGIGGGQGGSQGGIIRISGGTVRAKGGKEAAGIGGGAYYGGGGGGGTVIITGGTVQATCGTGCKPSETDGGCAIGSGKGVSKTSDGGTLTIGKTMMVSAGGEWSLEKKILSQQENGCRWNASAKIERCDHSCAEALFSIEDGFTHAFTGCIYCDNNYSYEEHIFGNDGKCRCGLLALNDNASNVSTIETCNGQTLSVTLAGRTLYKDGTWNTLCLPFSTRTNKTILENATIKTLISSSYDSATGTLTLNFSDYNVNTLNAGWPYIVRWENTYMGDDIKNPYFFDVTFSTPDNGDRNTDYVIFKGITSPMEIEGGDKSILYLGDDNTLYYPNGDMTISAFRGYFELKNDLSFGDLTQGNINAFVLDFGGESDSIEDVQHTTTHPSDVWYTVDGRKISGMPNARGLYIKNGKKVIIN